MKKQSIPKISKMKILNLFPVDLNGIKAVDSGSENLYRIYPPYYALADDHECAVKKKVVFFGNCFTRVPGIDRDRFAIKVNECLDFIRKECRDCDLFYRPHPSESNETSLLNLTNFRIVDHPSVAEQYLWEDRNNIKYAFSILSTASIAAYELGIASYVFYKVFGDAVSDVWKRALNDHFKRIVGPCIIESLSDKLMPSALPMVATALIKHDDDILTKNLSNLLVNTVERVWLVAGGPDLIMVLISIAGLIKSISPKTRVNLVVAQHRRWKLVDLGSVGKCFDEILFFPRASVSLGLRTLWQSVKMLWRVRKLDVRSGDIVAGFSPGSLVENGLVSYFNKNKRLAFVNELDFEASYEKKRSVFFGRKDFAFTKASFFSNKIFNPLFGLYRTLYLEYIGKEGGSINVVSRYEKPITEIYDEVYLLTVPKPIYTRR